MPYLRLPLTAGALLTALFFLLAMLICAQPFNSAPLHEFLALNVRCPQPCWQGIRPGETTTGEAVALLGHHPWVAAVYEHISFSTPGRSLFSWEWTGLQPTLIDANYPGALDTRFNRIETVRMRTHIRMGELWLALPSAHVLFDVHTLDERTRVILFYPESGFEAHFSITCPLKPGAMWRARAGLYFVYRPADAENTFISAASPRQLVCRRG